MFKGYNTWRWSSILSWTDAQHGVFASKCSPTTTSSLHTNIWPGVWPIKGSLCVIWGLLFARRKVKTLMLLSSLECSMVIIPGAGHPYFFVLYLFFYSFEIFLFSMAFVARNPTPFDSDWELSFCLLPGGTFHAFYLKHMNSEIHLHSLQKRNKTRKLILMQS